MATSVEQSEDHLPVFELSYCDSITTQAQQVRSRQGKIFLRLANGAALQWISLRIVSSAIPLKLKYKCSYKQKDSGADAVAEALEGDRCPQEDALYIKKIAFMSKMYYRCWLARDQRPEELEQKSGGMFWCYNGQFCGTEEDDRWITALEIKMPPLVNRTQLSR
jgi:hypothetical protein